MQAAAAAGVVSAAAGLSAADRHVLAAVSKGAAALSLSGSAFIVLCYFLFKEIHKFSFKLVFFLVLSDMFCSFFTIVGDPSNSFFCYAQDYSVHFFCVASFLWTTTIAFTLHRTVVKHKTDVEDYGSIFHLYVWGTSLATTVIRSIGSDFGRSGSWCWTEPARSGKACLYPEMDILPLSLHVSLTVIIVILIVCTSLFLDVINHADIVAHLVTFYGPLWSAILYNGFTYYQVNRTLNNATRMAVALSERPNQFDTRAEKKAFNRWGYYPLILIGSWSFATINRLYGFVNPDHNIFWLSLFDVGFSGLMGLFNSIAYGLNSSVRRAITERLDLWIPAKFRGWFPASSNLRSQQQENELTSLIVEGQK